MNTKVLKWLGNKAVKRKAAYCTHNSNNFNHKTELIIRNHCGVSLYRIYEVLCDYNCTQPTTTLTNYEIFAGFLSTIF